MINNTTDLQKGQHIFVPTWLYIKQHKHTGLKYFGKTIRKDPTKYKGSGTYWLNHIKQHGNDVDTVWCELFTTQESLVENAITFSKNNNIVESKDWANLIPEDGRNIGGPKSYIRTDEHKRNISKSKKGKPCSPESRANLDRGRNNRIYTPMSKQSKEKMRNSKLGKTVSQETKDKLKLARANQLASNNICYKIIGPNTTCSILNRLEIKQYCKMHNLAYTSLLAKGKHGKTYKGHQAIKIEDY